jgi:hypothetical protein
VAARNLFAVCSVLGLRVEQTVPVRRGRQTRSDGSGEMFERTTKLDVVYVPWHGVAPDDAIRAGAAWLRQQPGQRVRAAERALNRPPRSRGPVPPPRQAAGPGRRG